ncbi:cytochrome P450 [Fomitopsis serialis]|uniref:cytochrome P450 n=1 Tax=Fomitopsis serialis TaxID=139415 RepID=UPI0020072D43|nr:cytochrome P450 [Neoantrodia serialis]KAH9922456.1 cytochrome P450 [Neoantrodia serialis]
MTTPIPCPPSLPFLGHVTQIDKEVPLRSFILLSKQYGEIYELLQFSRSLLVVSTYELMNDVCDDKRFVKNPQGGALTQVRNGVGDGLFTAQPGEENWELAHRLLMPAFGTGAIRGMFDDMYDIAMQLILKWERFGPSVALNPAEDFTRLTFDTIALCSMSYRLNSFYRESNPPFVESMVDFLIESGQRAFRPSLVTNMMGYNAKYEQDIKVMADLAHDIIADRRANPTDKNDLLNRMLLGKDPKTGKSLPDENIKNNLLTFLIAGHETTSSTLSFLMYFILKKPEVMRKLREEIDEVLGDEPPQIGDLTKLPYLTACLREALRMGPAAPMRSVEVWEDTTIGGGKYAVKKGQTVAILTAQALRDPKVWGEDAEVYNPERMLDGKFEALPPNAWQPFGFGMRACIGRAFALQEMQLIAALIFQRFDVMMDDPSYELVLKQTLTIKPRDFRIRVAPRKDKGRPVARPTAAFLRGHVGTKGAGPGQTTCERGAEARQPMYVLYGSNTGTSETFAQRVVNDAAARGVGWTGFHASMGTLDAFVAKLPTDGPVVIITASFEGEPADNAAHFVDWLSNLKGSELANVRFAVFGCGNRDWVQTFQRIPMLIDARLEERGAQRVIARGVGDASAGDFFETFDEWEAGLWEALSKEYGTAAMGDAKAGLVGGLEVKTVGEGTYRASVLRQPDAALGTVVENTLLTPPEAPAKRHIEFQLPEGTSYRAGDYLAILPSNPQRDVHRVVARFGLSPEQEIVLSSSGPTPLPVDRPVTIQTLLSGYVELSQPATTRDIRILQAAENAPTEALQALSASYTEQVLNARLSVLDILEDHPSIKLPFPTYLQLLPAMRIRQYSISSSPLWNPSHVTLTVSVVDAPSRAGRKDAFLGVASTFLAGLRPGDRVQLAVRASSAAFHPPADPAVPMLLFAAGSGLAPMRGFLQERAMQKKAGREVAKSLLFFGCRRPGEDLLYGETDLKEWQELGILDVKPAFSRAVEQSKGCKYVQDRAWLDREEVREAYNAQAKLYTCGSRKVAQGIKEVLTKIIKEAKGIDDTMADEMFQHAIKGRYATDIFE